MTEIANDLSKLNDAIGSVSKETLVSMVVEICRTNPSAREFVIDELFVTEDKVPQPGTPCTISTVSEGDDDSDNSGEAVPHLEATGSKRQRTRYAVCENCKEEFDVTKNTRRSCSYHPG